VVSARMKQLFPTMRVCKHHDPGDALKANHVGNFSLILECLDRSVGKVATSLLRDHDYYDT
jgi:hypothetical protein